MHARHQGPVEEFFERRQEMTLYVNINACKDGNGTKESPFRHINDAAQIAKPDTAA